MRVAAILGPVGKVEDVRRFSIAGVDITFVTELTPEGKSDFDAVLIFGGDGTVHRQLRALHDRRLPLLVVPVGSGNDFARELGITTVARAEQAWRQFVRGAGMVREVDLGVIRPLPPAGSTAGGRATSNPAESDREAGEETIYFCCVAGTGIDSLANRRANAMPRWWRAHGGYALAAVREMWTFRPIWMRIEATASPQSVRFDELATMVVFANSRSYGDGMYIAPRAEVEDGKLDVCFVRKTTKRRLFTFFPTVFAGKHLALPEVEYAQAECVRIETDPLMDVYADGELVCRTPVEATVERRALRVIV